MSNKLRSAKDGKKSSPQSAGDSHSDDQVNFPPTGLSRFSTSPITHEPGQASAFAAANQGSAISDPPAPAVNSTTGLRSATLPPSGRTSRLLARRQELEQEVNPTPNAAPTTSSSNEAFIGEESPTAIMTPAERESWWSRSIDRQAAGRTADLVPNLETHLQQSMERIYRELEAECALADTTPEQRNFATATAYGHCLGVTPMAKFAADYCFTHDLIATQARVTDASHGLSNNKLLSTKRLAAKKLVEVTEEDRLADWDKYIGESVAETITAYVATTAFTSLTIDKQRAMLRVTPRNALAEPLFYGVFDNDLHHYSDMEKMLRAKHQQRIALAHTHNAAIEEAIQQVDLITTETQRLQSAAAFNQMYLSLFDNIISKFKVYVQASTDLSQARLNLIQQYHALADVTVSGENDNLTSLLLIFKAYQRIDKVTFFSQFRDLLAIRKTAAEITANSMAAAAPIRDLIAKWRTTGSWMQLTIDALSCVALLQSMYTEPPTPLYLSLAKKLFKLFEEMDAQALTTPTLDEDEIAHINIGEEPGYAAASSARAPSESGGSQHSQHSKHSRPATTFGGPQRGSSSNSDQAMHATPCFNVALKYCENYEKMRSNTIGIGGGTRPPLAPPTPAGLQEAMAVGQYPTASAKPTGQKQKYDKEKTKAVEKNIIEVTTPMFTVHVGRKSSYYNRTNDDRLHLYTAITQPCPLCAGDANPSKHQPACWIHQCSKCKLYGHPAHSCHQDPDCYSTGTFVPRK